jgi:3-hydroxyacyl-CoA dehydrogenase
MSDLVQFTKDNGIAVITINNPPVNALSPGVPEGISEAIERISNDPEIMAAVLIGGGRTFVAGADIKEFGKMVSGRAPRGAGMLPFLLCVEDSRKPIVVAIHGTAFGGGLELAMSGHYRVAVPSAQVGQPEVKLGIIPGAAGTQRLPRLAGVAAAVEMCTDGKPVSAEKALALGIIDKLVDGDLLAGAIAFAREVASKPAPKTRERNGKLGTPEQNAPIFAAARENARKKQRGLLAPVAAIDAVEAATKLPFEEGCKVEQELFIKCLMSDQSKALIHVFFGEREVAKIPDIPKDTPLIPVKRRAVVGAGTMGGGIAMVLANAGIPVTLKETDQAALDRGMATIRKITPIPLSAAASPQEYRRRVFEAHRAHTNLDGFAAVDMVIEAVFEGMALKKEIFAELDRMCKPGAILASNTSTLSIDEIAAATSRPESVIGTHFFSPANVMRLLEIVRGKTGKEVIATCMQLSKTIGKIGVLVGNCRGFVGNRMFGPYRREAQFLVEEGASIEAVDKALFDFGMAMGPLATGDLAGLDVGWRIRKEFKHLEKPGVRQPFAEDSLCELGRYGQKTGAGWYKYDAKRQASTPIRLSKLF